MVKIFILLCLIILLYLIYCDIAPSKIEMFIAPNLNGNSKLAKRYIISRFILLIITFVSIATIVGLTKIVWNWI